MKDEPTILFDGICNLCNSVVTFVIRRDKRARIKFAALQSDTGRKFLQQYKLPAEVFDSFVFIEMGICYTRSTAALKVCKYLTSLWPLLYGFIIVPTFIRNGIYNGIAKNRYKWFGKRQQCMVPTTGMKERFLP